MATEVERERATSGGTSVRAWRVSIAGVVAVVLAWAGILWWGLAEECGGGFIMLCLPRGLVLLLPSMLLADLLGDRGGSLWWLALAGGATVTLGALVFLPYQAGAALAALAALARAGRAPPR